MLSTLQNQIFRSYCQLTKRFVYQDFFQDYGGLKWELVLALFVRKNNFLRLIWHFYTNTFFLTPNCYILYFQIHNIRKVVLFSKVFKQIHRSYYRLLLFEYNSLNNITKQRKTSTEESTDLEIICNYFSAQLGNDMSDSDKRQVNIITNSVFKF